MWSGWMGLGAFASPEMRESFRIAVEAGQQVNEWWESIFQYNDEVKAKGFPTAWATFDWPPFDIIGDTLRGTRGILSDILRRPGQDGGIGRRSGFKIRRTEMFIRVQVPVLAPLSTYRIFASPPDSPC